VASEHLNELKYQIGTQNEPWALSSRNNITISPIKALTLTPSQCMKRSYHEKKYFIYIYRTLDVPNT